MDDMGLYQPEVTSMLNAECEIIGAYPTIKKNVGFRIKTPLGHSAISLNHLLLGPRLFSILKMDKTEAAEKYFGKKIICDIESKMEPFEGRLYKKVTITEIHSEKE